LAGYNFNKVKIANMALVRIGQKALINSLEETTVKPNEKIIFEVFDYVVNGCLSEIKPNFAIKYVEIQPNEDQNYLLPSDCIRVMSINNNRDLGAYRIEGNFIYPRGRYRDVPITLGYISNDLTSLQIATPLFVKYCSLVLAREIFFAIADNNNLQILNQIEREINAERISLLHIENLNNPTEII
jgi:hypothetical protein